MLVVRTEALPISGPSGARAFQTLTRAVLSVGLTSST